MYRSQWPHCLRHETFSFFNTRNMGSNPTRGMDVCRRFFCVHVVLCRYRPSDRADPPPKFSDQQYFRCRLIIGGGKQAVGPNVKVTRRSKLQVYTATIFFGSLRFLWNLLPHPQELSTLPFRLQVRCNLPLRALFYGPMSILFTHLHLCFQSCFYA
jgi:hypothetical protein